jgi:hypothetical protein
MEDNHDDSTPLTREEQQALVQKVFGSDSYAAYVEGFHEASRGLDMFASLRNRNSSRNASAAYPLSQPVGSITVPLNGTHEGVDGDVPTSELMNRAREIIPVLKQAEAERIAAQQQERARQEAARVERDKRVSISNERAMEFRSLMEKNGIPTTDHYGIRVQHTSGITDEIKVFFIGEGWIVTPSYIEKDDSTESPVDKHFEGLFLAKSDCNAYSIGTRRDIIQYSKPPYNVSISGTATFVWPIQDKLHPLEAPFADDIGVSALARALIRFGVAS